MVGLIKPSKGDLARVCGSNEAAIFLMHLFERSFSGETVDGWQRRPQNCFFEEMGIMTRKRIEAARRKLRDRNFTKEKIDFYPKKFCNCLYYKLNLDAVRKGFIKNGLQYAFLSSSYDEPAIIMDSVENLKDNIIEFPRRTGNEEE